MKIRVKLLILLLAIALVPLVVSAVHYQLSLYRFGSQQAEDTREVLSETAHRHLHTLVDDYVRLLRRDRKLLELLVRLQAQEVQRRLAKSPSPGLFNARDAEGGTISGDSYRLSTLPEAYRFLRNFEPDLVSRQVTVLESGFESGYPALKTGPTGRDPRLQSWYGLARESGSLVWSVEPVKSGGSPAMVAAAPVYNRTGTFAGVTAVEIPFSAFFRELDIPGQWSPESERMLVIFEQGTGDADEGLRILADLRGAGKGALWQKPEGRSYLYGDDPQEQETLLKAVATGDSGVRELLYHGKKTHWIYGGNEGDQPFPLIIVSHDRIITQALMVEEQVRNRTITGLKTTFLILLGLIIVVAGLAFGCSRAVTRPLGRLAEGAEQLASGNYRAQVDIRTGDELEELGNIFNGLGAKLQEREQMARSLALARDIQQHLLPQGPPEQKGFDIYGGGISCDETGGDYYDFIKITGGGPGSLGIAVGDVSGHGIAAALLMASARGVLRTHAGCQGGDLAGLFNLLNRHLLRDTGDERFMTLFYGVLDAEARTLSWTSAGHGPVLLHRSRSGEVEELATTGLPLGIVAEAVYPPAGPVTLEEGDVLLAGTDGLWETRSPAGEVFGIRRLGEVLADCSKKPAQEIFSDIMARVNDFRGSGHQEDDMTLVVAKVT